MDGRKELGRREAAELSLNVELDEGCSDIVGLHWRGCSCHREPIADEHETEVDDAGQIV